MHLSNTTKLRRLPVSADALALATVQPGLRRFAGALRAVQHRKQRVSAVPDPHFSRTPNLDFAFRPIARVRTLQRDIVRKLRQVGFLLTLTHGAAQFAIHLQNLISRKQLSPDQFDHEYGTDTKQIVSVGGLDIPDDRLIHANRYEAVPADAFDRIMRELPIAYETFVFVDLGSGKGRALLLASRFPFLEIVGVEISAVLTRVSLSNICIFENSLQKCREIKALCQDALEYHFPRENFVLYLYNPFDDSTLRPLVLRICESIRQFPRKVFVIYYMPAYRMLWDEAKAFQEIRSTKQYVIYESKP